MRSCITFHYFISTNRYEKQCLINARIYCSILKKNFVPHHTHLQDCPIINQYLLGHNGSHYQNFRVYFATRELCGVGREFNRRIFVYFSTQFLTLTVLLKVCYKEIQDPLQRVT